MGGNLANGWEARKMRNYNQKGHFGVRWLDTALGREDSAKGISTNLQPPQKKSGVKPPHSKTRKLLLSLSKFET